MSSVSSGARTCNRRRFGGVGGDGGGDDATNRRLDEDGGEGDGVTFGTEESTEAVLVKLVGLWLAFSLLLLV